MERRRTPLDRMVDLMVAAPVCTLDAARRLAPAVGRAVRTRLATDPPEDHVIGEAGTGIDEPADQPAEEPADEPGDEDADRERPAPTDDAVDVPSALAIDDYDNLAARQVVDRLGGLDADELRAVAAHELAHRHRQTVLRRIEQLLS